MRKRARKVPQARPWPAVSVGKEVSSRIIPAGRKWGLSWDPGVEKERLSVGRLCVRPGVVRGSQIEGSGWMGPGQCQCLAGMQSLGIWCPFPAQQPWSKSRAHWGYSLHSVHLQLCSRAAPDCAHGPRV